MSNLNNKYYYTLEILPTLDSTREFYQNWQQKHAGDSGVDILCPYTLVSACSTVPRCRFSENTWTFSGEVVQLVGMGIKCRMLDPNGNTCSYYLYPRSSISKTPFMLANSVGIIDAGYRGEIKGPLRHFPTAIINETAVTSDIVIERQSLLQICAPNLGQIRVRVVDSLDETSRGEGGFGSTNRT